MSDAPVSSPARPETTSLLRLPAVVAGKRVELREATAARARVGQGVKALFPSLERKTVDTILADSGAELARLPLQEILSFLNRVGQNWKSEEYTRRRLYVRSLQETLGYSAKAAEAEADWIGILLSSHSRIYDLVENELGSRFVLDRWVPREEAEVRAFPLGLTLHVLPGNVPLSNVISMLRALVTKNRCLAKWATGDPFTPLAFALSLLDVDPRHPVSRAVSVLHWEHEDPLGAELAEAADGVCVWGGADAVRAARDATAEEASFTAFGPKCSVALVGSGADLRRAALGVAHDACVYEQRGCFSVQSVFVEAPLEPFLEELRKAMSEYEELLPPARESFDEAGRVSLALLEATYLGAEVVGAPGERWAVVVGGDPAAAIEHPQARTVYVHPVARLADAVPHLGPEVQTVAAAPWEALAELRDEIARRGVSRLVEAGLANVFRVGGSHDGIYPLTRLVRMVSVEAPARTHAKGMVLGLDQTELLRAGKLRTLVL
jgi:long-chain-fatty-acyl-CoA reductase